MAKVFLSYDRDDTERARPVALALEKAGHSVWWDLHIHGGEQYTKVIDEALKAADAVVVLWSNHSVDSAWVRDEAAAGRDSGRLVPVSLDGTDPPLGFRQFQTVDLTMWKGRGRPAELKTLLADVEAMARSRSAPEGTATPPPKSQSTLPLARFRSWPAFAAVLILLLGIAFIGWRLSRPEPIPAVAVTAVKSSASSDALARELLVKLGHLRSARTEAVRITAPAAGEPVQADFIFEAAASTDPAAYGANLTLLAGGGRAVLWSKDFEAAGSNRTALEQSMAYTAGQVLDCALQANAPSQPRLDEQTLKLFLNACALFGDRYRSDPESVVPLFTQVVSAAPKFRPAWSRLLLAEAQYTRSQMAFVGRFAPGALPEHIRAARKLNPQMPELYVAEAALLPFSDIIHRSRLLDEAVNLNPDNPDLLVTHAEHLSFIGRNNDAVFESRRAVELDPLSPGFRSNLIQILAYGGQFSAAEAELRRAVQLWPGTPTIDDARFRFNSRYGDAKDALHMLESAEFRQLYMTQDLAAYLVARIDPTESNIQRAISAAQTLSHRRTVQLVQLLSEFGRENEAYALLANLPPDQLRFASGVFFRPPLRKFRQDPRFMKLAVRAGLADFWRKSGKWPDFCFEPDLPYDCKKEAAKLAA